MMEILDHEDTEIEQLAYDEIKKQQLQEKRKQIYEQNLSMHEIAEQMIEGWERLTGSVSNVFSNHPIPSTLTKSQS